ncbi:hypothetical protein WJX81_001849 [Elliptochloris bilobata]|uniref:CNH domain-containing protein n=1 Tax=Elliptochloris bilobata TaxID=381761 RepID=A0AAW1SDU8_9CHLO
MSDFQAFTCEVVLDNFQKKIEALEVWEGRVFAGLADGTLMVLQEEPSTDVGPRWQVSQAVKGFGQRRILQLQAWPERSLLLCLCEDGLTAHRLPSLALACQATRTRSAGRFALDAASDTVAVAAKRRLLLLRFNGNEFEEAKELGLPDAALALGWCGASVCLGFRREYATMDTNTGALAELFTTGKPGAPLVTPLGGGELLLLKDSVGIALGADARPARRPPLNWSDAPAAVAVSAPYALGLLPAFVEIRGTARAAAGGPAQVLPLQDMAVAAPSTGADGCVYVASRGDAGIRRLAPVAFATQARALADAGEFAEALELTALIPSSEGTEGFERTRLVDMLHTRYAHALFGAGDYDGAFAHFGMCSAASPLVLLRLFPSLAPPALLADLGPSGYDLPEVPEPSGEAFVKAVSLLLPYLLSHRSRIGYRNEELAALAPQQRRQLAEAVDTAILKAMLVMSDTGALLRFVQRPNAASLEEGRAALQAAGRYSELVALYQRRGQHQAALSLLRTLSQAPEELAMAPRGAAAELAGLTGVWAAVKYLVSVGSQHMDLIQAHAQWILSADPEAGLEMLLQARPPLAPAAVLPILSAQVPALCAPYLEAAIALGVASPCGFHDELVRIYLRAVIEQRRGDGAAANGAAASGAASGAGPGPAAALPAGGRGGDGGECGGGASGVEGDAWGQGAVRGAQPGDQPQLASRPDPYTRLKELVTTSQHIDAARLLLLAPKGGFLELRALLLERLDRHMDALRIYVHSMKAPRLAEAYCDRLYERRARGLARAPSAGTGLRLLQPAWSARDMQPGQDIYLALVEVYLERQGDDGAPGGSAPDSSNWEEVARLLSRKHGRIDSLHALNLLPGQVPLRAVLPFLEGGLRSAGEQRRNSTVVRSLRRAENLQVREELIRCRQRSVVVTFERASG